MGVQVIGAAADDMSSLLKVKLFIKEAKINFPVWLGATAQDMERVGLGAALPGTLIIGRDGRIIASIRGAIKAAYLRKQLDALLARAEEQIEKQTTSASATPDKASSVPC